MHLSVWHVSNLLYLAIFSLFKFPFYSESPSNDQTAAVCKIKAASCLYKTRKHVSISSALHVCCDLTVILFSHGSF